MPGEVARSGNSEPCVLDNWLHTKQSTCLVPLPMQSLVGVPWLPPSISGLTRLQRLCAQREYPHDFLDLSLPSGPWLGSLRWLGLPWDCLDAPGALEVLRSATRLEFLCSLSLPYIDTDSDGCWDHWDAFFEFLVAHPSLRCFGERMGAFMGGGRMVPTCLERLAPVPNIAHAPPCRL